MKASFSIVDVKTAIPVLAKAMGRRSDISPTISLEGEGGDDSEVIAQTFDGQVMLSAAIKALECEAGSVNLDAAMLSGIVSKAGAGNTLNIDAPGNGQCAAHCGVDQFKIAVTDTTFSADIDQEAQQDVLIVNGDEFADALTACAKTAAKNDVRITMNGVNVLYEKDEGVLSCAGTDGSRGLVAVVQEELEGGTDIDVILSHVSVNAIKEVLKADAVEAQAAQESQGGDDDDPPPPQEVELSVNEDSSVFRVAVGRYVLHTTLINGSYPPLRRLMRDKPPSGAIVVNTGEAADALGLVKVCARLSVGLRSGKQDSHLRFVGADERGNNAEVQMQISTRGDPLEKVYSTDNFITVVSTMSADNIALYNSKEPEGMLCVMDNDGAGRRSALLAPRVDPLLEAMLEAELAT